ncbi:uncharacterized protein YbaA (DUF1428 family) [Microbacterium trichothecenolyticum]|uniref:hypothetical protein n=1 Tax=Microbacterium trichothecenolyticum TaxID=69370 RepID=UPI0028630A01|nr:hypothetical protein [Microbacterium trichothecenolyticum]MDR7113755.1 uncharacterized protein YbaA (DUF1428 family) [Microbacterium trichothecenolyticum]
MPGATSPWRVNDVVAYDRMREAAVTVFAELHAVTRRDAFGADAARQELVELRRAVLTVDAYDRAAVADLARRIDAVLQRLEGRTP